MGLTKGELALKREKEIGLFSGGKGSEENRVRSREGGREGWGWKSTIRWRGLGIWAGNTELRKSDRGGRHRQFRDLKIG